MTISRLFTITVTTRYTVDIMNSLNGQVLMTRAPSTEGPCAVNVAFTVLKASGRSYPVAEPDVLKRRYHGLDNVRTLFQRLWLDFEGYRLFGAA
jgi:hypothetical protein